MDACSVSCVFVLPLSRLLLSFERWTWSPKAKATAWESLSNAAWGVGKGMLSGVPGLVSRSWWACTPALWTFQVLLSFVYPIRWDRITRVSQGWALAFPRSVRLRWASLGGRPCHGEQKALAYLKMVLSPPTRQNGKGTSLQHSLGGPGRVSGYRRKRSFSSSKSNRSMGDPEEWVSLDFDSGLATLSLWKFIGHIQVFLALVPAAVSVGEFSLQ